VDVIPQRILVPPGEVTPFTLKVYSDAESGDEGEVTLTFATSSADIAIANDTHTWQARVALPGLGAAIFLCAAVLLAVGFVGFIVVRRRRGR
jgi:hypothetical protein